MSGPRFAQHIRYALSDLCERRGLSADACDLIGRLALDADWRTGAVPGSVSELAERYRRPRKRVARLLDELARAGVVDRDHRPHHDGSLTILPWTELVRLPGDRADALESRRSDAIHQGGHSEPSQIDAVHQGGHDDRRIASERRDSGADSDAIHHGAPRRSDAIHQEAASRSQGSRESPRVPDEDPGHGGGATATPDDDEIDDQTRFELDTLAALIAERQAAEADDTGRDDAAAALDDDGPPVECYQCDDPTPPVRWCRTADRPDVGAVEWRQRWGSLVPYCSTCEPFTAEPVDVAPRWCKTCRQHAAADIGGDCPSCLDGRYRRVARR